MEAEKGRLPSVIDGDDASHFLGELGEDGHGQVEVLVRGVAPSAIGAVWAEVGGRHHHRGSAKAVARARGVAGQLEARPAAEPGVEQGGAQGGCVGAVACAVEVSKSTSTTCMHQTIHQTIATLVSSMHARQSHTYY